MPDFDALCRSGGGRKIGRSAGKLPGQLDASGVPGAPAVNVLPAGTRDTHLAHTRDDLLKRGTTGTENGPRGPKWLRQRAGVDFDLLGLPRIE